MLSFCKILGALAVVSGVSAQNFPGPGPVSGNTFTHDPTVVKTPSDGYLMGFTAPGIGLKTSSDRTAWRDAGVAFPNGASWVTPYTGDAKANLWAPDLSYHNGQYYMYYSASSFGTRKSAIFLATSKTGASGSWTNKGKVVETSANSDHNAIDPNLIIDAQGKWWLSYGSFWGGLKVIAINPSTGLRSGSELHSIARRTEAGGAIEAPVITRQGNYYYLWVSFDKCCEGAASTYNIRVGRSSKVTGPYLDKSGRDMMNGGGTLILGSHGSIHGPGHCAVIKDNDADVLFYHYYQNNGDAKIGINLIRYDNGWPTVY